MTQAVPIRFPEDVYEALRARGYATRTPMAELVRRYVRDGLAADQAARKTPPARPQEHTR